MKLHELKNTVKRPNRRRVGRGDGSGSGRTSGRGEKGAGARTGHTSRPFFEGGQIPLIRRLPKRGFNNPNHIEYEVVNLNVLDENFKDGEVVTREELQKRGLISKTKAPLKILANGELSKNLKVEAEKFSKTAKAAIEAKGGSCVEVTRKAAAAEA
ncbi:MAG: 50S ribosomal protein L15 [Victivallales bacterium]|nr:50S ribosomal protein L15 [Victivallales bacterium]